MAEAHRLALLPGLSYIARSPTHHINCTNQGSDRANEFRFRAHLLRGCDSDGTGEDNLNKSIQRLLSYLEPFLGKQI